jgi:hypothetical protein
MAWNGDPAASIKHIGVPGENMWLALGQGQIAFAIAMGTGTDADLTAARTALKTAEDISLRAMEANQPDSVLASMWKSLSIWDSKPNTPSSSSSSSSGSVPADRMRLWMYFSSLMCQAEIQLNVLTLCLKERQWVSIALHARRCYKLCEEADGILKQIRDGMGGSGSILDPADKEEENDVISRLEFVVGLFHFCVSLVPPGLMMLVEAIGFEADRAKGLRELTSAMNRRGIHYPTASVVLIAFYNFFRQEYDPAAKLIEDMAQSGYATSPAGRLIAGTVFRRNGDMKRAIQAYQEGISGVVNQPQVVLILEAELGSTYFIDGNWSEAAPLLKRFVENTTNRQYRVASLWKLGLCYWMMGVEGRVEIVSGYCEKVIEMADGRFAYERYAARISKRFLAQKKYTKFEELWFHAWSYNQARRFQDSNAILQQAVDLVKSQSSLGPQATELPQAMVECVSLCLYLKMSNQNGLERMDDATEALQKLLKVQNEVVDELWVVPYAYVEMGELCLKLAAKGHDVDNMTKKASVCFERASSFADYDFDRPLSFRIARGKDILRNAAT